MGPIGIVMPLGDARGGAERMLMQLLAANRAGPGIPYTLAFLSEGPLAAEAAALGYPVTTIPAGRLRQPARLLGAVRGLRDWLRGTGAAAAVSWMPKAHLYAGPAALLAGVPACWWQHGITAGHWLDRAATLLPARAVFCSSLAAAAGQARLRPRRPIRVVYPAADLARFDPDRLPAPVQARRQLGLPEDGPLIGMVARLQRGKGAHVFLAAAAELARLRPDARFLVVGGTHWSEPGYPAALARQAEVAGIAGRVIFAGHQDDVCLWIQALDAFVHPATVAEAFGMVIVEAMALAKPVVVTAIGGPLELVTPGVDGLLVPPGEAAPLVTALAALIGDDGRGHELGAAARARAAQFGTDRLAAEFAGNLEEMLQ